MKRKTAYNGRRNPATAWDVSIHDTIYLEAFRPKIGKRVSRCDCARIRGYPLTDTKNLMRRDGDETVRERA